MQNDCNASTVIIIIKRRLWWQLVSARRSDQRSIAPFGVNASRFKALFVCDLGPVDQPRARRFAMGHSNTKQSAGSTTDIAMQNGPHYGAHMR
jgi:hypothetical protein